MEAYKRRTGKRMTYQILAEMSGVAEPTLHSIGSRNDYNATLATVEKICRALDVELTDMIEMTGDPLKAKRTTRKKKRAR